MSHDDGTARWSAGSNRPSRPVPLLAADCHHHVYEPAWPTDARALLRPPAATLDDYRQLQRRLGLTRHVVVQPSAYGHDNRGLLATLSAAGPHVRGIAALPAGTDDATFQALHAAGVRGLRANLWRAGPLAAASDVPALAARCAEHGWHLQVNADAQQILALATAWSRLPCPLVFDHLGHLPHPAATSHPAFDLLRGWMQDGQAWIKLSGWYNDSIDGPPGYDDAVALAAAYLHAAPSRVVWGTDWPHPTEAEDSKPNDADLLDLLDHVTSGDPDLWHRVLVTNAAQLYGW